MMPNKTLVVGIGSSHGDDQVGWRIVDEISRQAGSTVEAHKAASPSELLDWLSSSHELVICDACKTDGAPGGAWRWNWPTEAIESQYFSGSHDLSLSAVLQLAEHLGRLPPRVTIWGVNTASTQPMMDLSPNVAAAVPRVAQQIIEAVNHA